MFTCLIHFNDGTVCYFVDKSDETGFKICKQHEYKQF